MIQLIESLSCISLGAVFFRLDQSWRLVQSTDKDYLFKKGKFVKSYFKILNNDLLNLWLNIL